MANTTNFGWETPDDTDLVKDGAAAMRTLGNSIDASFVDLKGGTTGQVLAKNSNTDLDFTWSSVDPLTILDAKGDLITATAADAPARLAVGTNGQVLKADSTTATGLAWGSAASSLSIAQIVSGSTTSGTSLSLTSLTSYDRLKFRISGVTTSASAYLTATINSSSSGVYDYFVGAPIVYTTSYDGSELRRYQYSTSGTSIPFNIGPDSLNSNSDNYFMLDLYNCKEAGFTIFEWQCRIAASYGSLYSQISTGRGIFKSSAAVSSIQFNTSSAFTAGSYLLWGG
jgi:hypothetical protein